MHFCLGSPLSKLEMRVTLEAFMDFAPDARVVPQQLEYKPDVRIDGLVNLELDLGEVPADAPAAVAASV
jgi:cytochrome P450